MRVWLILTLLAASLSVAASDAVRERLHAAAQAQKAGDLTTAAAAYRDVLEQNPRLTIARHLLGICELQLGHLSEGIRQLETVRREDPANRQAVYTLVSTYVAAGLLDQANRILGTTLRGDTTAPGHLVRGSYAMAQGEYALAVRELKQARRLERRLPGATSQLGVALCFANQLDEAVPVLEAALQENPGDTNAAAFLGWLYKERDRTAEAATLLERSIRDRPDDKGALFLLAQLTQSRGDAAQATMMLEKVITLDPGHRAAHVLLARLYQQLHRTEEAARERGIVARLNAELQAAQPGGQESLR